MESDSILGIIGILLILFVYFLPTIIGRNKKNSTAIGLLNLFLGWTFIGWVVALIWASTYEEPPKQLIQKQKISSTPIDPIKRRKRLDLILHALFILLILILLLALIF